MEYDYHCYEEYICQAALEWYDNRLRFDKSERPDFIDSIHSIGMEVTIAQIGKHYENSMKYAKFKSGKCRNPEKMIKELNRAGKIADIGYSQIATDGNPTDSVVTLLDKKLKKLDSWYAKVNQHWLTFFLEAPFMRCHLDTLANSVFQKQKEYAFDKVFIVASDVLIEIDCQSKILKTKDISFDEISEFYRIAKENCKKINSDL